jgi:thiol-disulfide isomerase/thioredoxin
VSAAEPGRQHPGPVRALSAAWRRLRARFWWSLAFDALLLAAIFLAIHAWQTRNLPDDVPAPRTVLALLDGGEARDAVVPGKVGVVYFFAPWCFYCKTSIGNLDDLVADGRVDWATAVALDYGEPEEVRSFVAGTGISLPVLMGDPGTAADWSVRAFPTYYVIDSKGRIDSRSVGYSTLLGMLARTRLAD